MKRRISASIRAPDDTTTELRIAVAAPLGRAPTERQSILSGVFPAGAWTREANSKASAEYQYLRSAAGWCRQCPNRLGRYKHRCDDCQAKERARWQAKSAEYRAARPPPLRTVKRRKSPSKFSRAAKKWLRLRKKDDT